MMRPRVMREGEVFWHSARMVDAGWVRPEIRLEESDLWQLPESEFREVARLLRTGVAPGVEVWRSDDFGRTRIRVRDARPCVTELPPVQ